MTRTRSGLHDRRGFEGPLKICLGLMAVSLLLIFYSWKIGLGLLMFFCVTFIVLELISSPPANRPEVFITWARQQRCRRPVLLCLGDSITHGNVSASYTPEIPEKLCTQLGLDPPKLRRHVFSDPLWVVNAGQNGITSHTILNERLNQALASYPDYITIMIGTNDVLAMCNKSLERRIVDMNELPGKPSMQIYERNLRGIVNYIRQASPNVQLALCTLPPITEDLNSQSNVLVREANAIIERVAESDDAEKCSVIPVYSRLEAILEKKRKSSWLTLGLSAPIMLIQNYLFHFPGGVFTWNQLSAMFSQQLLPDAIHLNETGRDEIVDAMIEWLLKKNVAKAIAVKAM